MNQKLQSIKSIIENNESIIEIDQSIIENNKSMIDINQSIIERMKEWFKSTNQSLKTIKQ